MFEIVVDQRLVLLQLSWRGGDGNEMRQVFQVNGVEFLVAVEPLRCQIYLSHASQLNIL